MTLDVVLQKLSQIVKYLSVYSTVEE